MWFVACLVLGYVVIGTHATYASDASDPKPVELARPMDYVRLYSDSTGASHFSDEELTFTLADFAPPAPPISVSAAIQSESAAFISSAAGWVGNWHPAPRRQYWICLIGQLEVEVSDGEVRTFGPGTVVLVEDTWGKGHISRVVGKERCYAVVVPLKEE
jgi:hypothetical protein